MWSVTKRPKRFDGPAVDRARRIFDAWYKNRWKTQTKAAEALGVNQSVISEFANGVQGIGAVLLSAIAQVDPEVALDMLGASSSNARVQRIAAMVSPQAGPPEKRLWGVQMAMLFDSSDAPDESLARAAEGIIALSEVASIGAPHSVVPLLGPGHEK